MMHVIVKEFTFLGNGQVAGGEVAGGQVASGQVTSYGLQIAG